MSSRVWIRELSEVRDLVWHALQSFWTDGILPLLATVGSFLIMAAPILLVMLLLWLLDLSGWRPGPGFYTIGAVVADVIRT